MKNSQNIRVSIVSQQEDNVTKPTIKQTYKLSNDMKKAGCG